MQKEGRSILNCCLKGCVIVWGNRQLMGMVAGIDLTTRGPNSQATIDATQNQRGVDFLEGRKVARPFFLINLR